MKIPITSSQTLRGKKGLSLEAFGIQGQKKITKNLILIKSVYVMPIFFGEMEMALSEGITSDLFYE